MRPTSWDYWGIAFKGVGIGLILICLLALAS